VIEDEVRGREGGRYSVEKWVVRKASLEVTACMRPEESPAV